MKVLVVHNRYSSRVPSGENVSVANEVGWLRDAGYYTSNLVEMPASCGFKGTGKTDWNFTQSAKLLGVTRQAIQQMVRRFELQPNRQMH